MLPQHTCLCSPSSKDRDPMVTPAVGRPCVDPPRPEDLTQTVSSGCNTHPVWLMVFGLGMAEVGERSEEIRTDRAPVWRGGGSQAASLALLRVTQEDSTLPPAGGQGTVIVGAL